MTVPVVAFFNNKAGVGKTSLVYHLAWMLSDLGKRVLAADLDPQSNLSSAFLDEDQILQYWPESGEDRPTVFGAIKPLLRGISDIREQPSTAEIDDGLHLVVGDLDLAGFEDELAQQWPLALDQKERAFRVLSAFWRVLQRAAVRVSADVVLADLGPNLGSINRAALIASDYLVIPVAPDLFSLQGLHNLGPALAEWRRGWQERLARSPDPALELPTGTMTPLGYIVLQHAVRLDRPVKAYEKWIRRIPEVYDRQISKASDPDHLTFDTDPDCLGLIKHYRSLMPMAQEARKPIFHLKPADGAIGAHGTAVVEAYAEMKRLAQELTARLETERLDRPPVT